MITDSAHYVLGRRQHLEPIPLNDAAACRRGGSSFVWIDLHEPSGEVMAELHDRFGLHELAIEDAEQAHQRPKLEQYDDFYYIVFRTARYDETRRQVDFGEVHLFVAPGYVIEVRHGAPGAGRSARTTLERRPQLLKSGPAAVVWGVLDEVVDDYRPIVDALESDIDDVERLVFAGEEDATERIYQLKQQVSAFYHAVHPLFAPLDALERGHAFAEIDPGLKRYFRDVHDHLRVIDDDVIAQRDQLASVLDANIALISLRQNRISAAQTDTMKKLTALATVFLPITFVTGFFGQNFAFLVDDLIASKLAFAIGVLVQMAVVVGLLLFFRRRHFM